MNEPLQQSLPGGEQVGDLTYEQAFNALNEVVTLLETEKMTLEQAMILFEHGQALTQRCAGLLDQAELKVQQLVGEDISPFESGS